VIAECLEYLATPCARPLSGMGYLRELLGIKARAHRCWAAWEPHLEQSKGVIRSAIAQCSQSRKAVILGSGMLYDVPLPDLATAFHEVLLVDIVHPLGTWWPWYRYPNVKTVTADVTGTADEVFRIAAQIGAALPQSAPSLYHDDHDVDLVVSLNLLSQLPYIPTTVLERGGRHSPESIQSFARRLIQAHLTYLERFSGVVTLITDVQKLKLDRHGQTVSRASALRGVDLPWRGEEWVWQMAPRPEIDEEYSYFRRVVGIANIKVAARSSGVLFAAE
jgi:hypothetical protein